MIASVRWLLWGGCSRLLRRRRRLSRGSCRAAAFNLDVSNFYRTKRPIVARVGGHVCNLFDQRHGYIVALPEERVFSIQMRRCNFSDEELRPVGIGSGVGIGETAGPVERQIGGNLILEFITRVARSIALGIAALNHEAGNHAMENGSIVKRYAMFGSAANRILPILRTGCEADEVLDADRSLVREQRAGHLARGSLDNRSRLTCSSMVYGRLGRRC